MKSGEVLFAVFLNSVGTLCFSVRLKKTIHTCCATSLSRKHCLSVCCGVGRQAGHFHIVDIHIDIVLASLHRMMSQVLMFCTGLRLSFSHRGPPHMQCRS